jgi:hypothetical protein
MRDVILLVLAAVVVAAAALGGLCLYSRRHLAALQGSALYPTPEEGMRILVSDLYSGVVQVEIAHAGYEPCFLNNLYFVEARVWAEARTAGKELGPEGDNPGAFFLRRGTGWAWVPEERRPWFVALGQRLFGDR